ncbi:MAG TPA: glycosyltransferase N-terminal domain-containing protein [Caulobacteraceae bacterium]|nr:glycosyltransferase N-terminal domain-containing protein [Caulobacteraceae bacterium]
MARLGERLGFSETPRPDGRLVWLHGVSVGEAVSLTPLAEQLLDRRRDVSVLMTSATPSSGALLQTRLPPGAFHQYAPVDTPLAARRFIRRWRPDAAVFVESELWPNLILAAKSAGARMALVSARLSEASLQRWRLAPRGLGALLASFDLVLARDEHQAAGLRQFGARIDGLADLKFGAPALPADTDEVARLRRVLADRGVILAASTHKGEEELVLRAAKSASEGRAGRPLVVLAPRHVDRADEIGASCERLGFAWKLRSSKGNPSEVDALVIDAMGEMGIWYRLARLAVIGGSFRRGVGGHNPLEAARLGCPFVCGPFFENWPVHRELANLGATELVTGEMELKRVLLSALQADDVFASRADAAAAFVRDRDAATRAAMVRIAALMD